MKHPIFILFAFACAVASDSYFFDVSKCSDIPPKTCWLKASELQIWREYDTVITDSSMVCNGGTCSWEYNYSFGDDIFVRANVQPDSGQWCTEFSLFDSANTLCRIGVLVNGQPAARVWGDTLCMPGTSRRILFSAQVSQTKNSINITGEHFSNPLAKFSLELDTLEFSIRGDYIDVYDSSYIRAFLSGRWHWLTTISSKSVGLHRTVSISEHPEKLGRSVSLSFSGNSCSIEYNDSTVHAGLAPFGPSGALKVVLNNAIWGYPSAPSAADTFMLVPFNNNLIRLRHVRNDSVKLIYFYREGYKPQIPTAVVANSITARGHIKHFRLHVGQSTATVQYYIWKPGAVSASVFDAAGRSVFCRRTYVSTLGQHMEEINMQSLSSGLYIVEVEVCGNKGCIPFLLTR